MAGEKKIVPVGAIWFCTHQNGAQLDFYVYLCAVLSHTAYNDAWCPLRFMKQMNRQMKRLSLWCVLLGCLLSCLCSCDTEKSPEELFEGSKSGVVLILNRYYYQMKLPNGKYLYFTGLDGDGDFDFTADRNEILSKAVTLSGTGFFIDRKGTIMTNRHVAQPVVDKSAVKTQLNNLLNAIRTYYTLQMQNLQEQYAQLENEKSDCYTTDYYGNSVYDADRYDRLEEQESELRSSFQALVEARDRMLDGNISLDELSITPVCEVGIAYDGTYVTSVDDFLKKNPCVVNKVSDKENVDLALIRLKSGVTPESAHVFGLGEEENPTLAERLGAMFGKKKDTTLRIDQELYMIGYNAGPALATTKQGIKVQMTSGKITQLPDGERLLYSIPTVQGSSGSPVLDKSGRVVAVNYAKLAVSDNFNFGIPLNKILAFVGKQ